MGTEARTHVPAKTTWGAELRRITLFPTCLATLLFPRAAGAARRVLQRAGFEVSTPGAAVCCGQPAWNSGHIEEARRVARGALEGLGGEGPIVLCSGSCTTMVSHYWVELFEGTEHEEEARAVAARAREFSSFVAEATDEGDLGELRSPRTVAVAYHDSCHMLRGLGVSRAPRALLDRVAGLEVRDLDAQERCCGFGGTFSLRYPELSSAMADEKVDDIAAHDVDEVIGSDLGCLMQIRGRAGARGMDVPCRYIAEVLDEAMDGAR
jgi:L-lactate dehydrogenase complex protein LldE